MQIAEDEQQEAKSQAGQKQNKTKATEVGSSQEASSKCNCISVRSLFLPVHFSACGI